MINMMIMINDPTTTVFRNATRPPSLEKNQFAQCESTAPKCNTPRRQIWLISCEWVWFHVARTVTRSLLSRVLSRGVVLRGDMCECGVVQNFFCSIVFFCSFSLCDVAMCVWSRCFSEELEEPWCKFEGIVK